MKTLQALGWNWRTDGVEVCAQVDGQRYQIFVPLSRVWHEFAKALAENGTPMPAQVGAHISVAGLFQGIEYASRTPAVGWFGSSIAHAVSKAASSVTHAALAPVASVFKPVANLAHDAVNELGHVPVFGSALSAAANIMTAPVGIANQLVQGGKISGVAMNALKSQLGSIKTLAPYVQSVVSMVPGVGSGLSGALGAGLALASGMSITQAVEQGIRDSLPGGPLAQAAFDVATAAAQGKPISQIALAALPISPQQKNVLVQGVGLARDLANGKNVSHALIDAALVGLPPEAQKAIQIASAVAHAKSLQQAVSGVAQAAGVNQALANGMNAAQQLMRHPPSLPAPPHLVQAVQQGLAARNLVAQVTNAAAQGHGPSAQFLSFLQKPHISAPLPVPHHHHGFKARFHTGPAHPAHAAAAHKAAAGKGIHSHLHQHHGGATGGHKNFTARFHTGPAHPHHKHGGHHGIHKRFQSAPAAVSAPWPHGPFSYGRHTVPQLFPVRMPYQTEARLRYAYGR